VGEEVRACCEVELEGDMLAGKMKGGYKGEKPYESCVL